MSARLRRLVELDGAVWLAADPATGMPTAPTLIENARRTWAARDVPPLLGGRVLGRGRDPLPRARALGAPAAALRLATGDRPRAAIAIASCSSPHGIGDELRAVLRVDGCPWGLLSLFRERRASRLRHRRERVRGEPERAAGRCGARPHAAAHIPAEPGARGRARPADLRRARAADLAQRRRRAPGSTSSAATTPSSTRPASGCRRWSLSTLIRARAIAESATTVRLAPARAGAQGAGWSATPPACARRRRARRDGAGDRGRAAVRDRPDHRRGLRAVRRASARSPS